MPAYLWGLRDGMWHALTRHDPEYHTKEVESEKLTALARAKNPDAAPVMKRVSTGEPDGPGHGTTLCGLEKSPLTKIGVDPEPTDPLCVVCKSKAGV